MRITTVLPIKSAARLNISPSSAGSKKSLKMHALTPMCTIKKEIRNKSNDDEVKKEIGNNTNQEIVDISVEEVKEHKTENPTINQPTLYDEPF